MKRLADLWNDIGKGLRPRLELPEGGARALGFQPAVLDVATMRIQPWGSPASAGHTVIAGFERGGFFYTRSATARACKEWGFGV
jgi:hypothetical protein